MFGLDFNTVPTLQTHDFLPPLSRWVKFGGLFIVGAIGTAIAIASVARYQLTVKASATIRPTGELRLVQAATEGVVMQISAMENQTIRQGEVIARIDDSRLQTKKNQLLNSIHQARRQILQMDAQIQALERQVVAESERRDRAVASSEAELRYQLRKHHDQKAISSTEVKEAEAMLRTAEAALNTARLKVRRYLPVVKVGALDRDRLDEAELAVQQQEQEVVAARAKLKRAKTSLNPTDAEVVIASERIAQERATASSTIAALNKEQQALIGQQFQLQNQLNLDTQELKQVEIELSKTAIVATVDGIIAKLNLRNAGQTVQPGAEIAQIVPKDTRIAIKALVTAQDIGKVAVGQKTQLRISACPYPDYGTLAGVVKTIAPDVRTSPNLGSSTTVNSSQQDRVTIGLYELTIAPESLVLKQGSRQCHIQVGMEGRIDIISQEDTVLRSLLRKARLLADL